MSYYSSPWKYKLTHHSIRRAKERLKLNGCDNNKIHEVLEGYLENSVFCGYQENGCLIMKNYEHNITIVLDNSGKVIMTVY